ncbi:hypothetical protein QYE76_025810 [Lolium multiflorum]|uniref:Integrase zinc-binding domain-containing protein n=1 Tax=Lolium multiflorum TaxID=4521 RepID=A0AAD8RJB8_LOLMU|nr:hypothetical protein QYE76_025810 [Lolium multiflorum]
MKEFSDVFPEEVPAGLPPLRGIEQQIDLIPAPRCPIGRHIERTPKRRRRYRNKYKRYSAKESHAGGLMGHFGREKTLLMLADHFYWPKMRHDVDSYEEEPSIARGGEEQLDKKLDVKMDMELDMKTSHGRAREEREACTRGGDLQRREPVETAVRRPPQPGRSAPTPDEPGPDRLPRLCQPGRIQ